MIFSIPSFTKGDVCPLDGRWYLSSWREKANFPPEKILQQNALDRLDKDNPEYPHALRLWYRNGGNITHEYIKHIRKSVRKEIFDYLHSLPLNIDIEVNGQPYILVHGGAIATYHNYMYRYDNQEEYAVWNRIYYNEPDIEGKIIIFGHKGQPVG